MEKIDFTKVLPVLSTLAASWVAAILSGFLSFGSILISLGKFDIEVPYGGGMFAGVVAVSALVAVATAVLTFRLLGPWMSRQSLPVVVVTFLVLLSLSILVRPRFFEFVIQ